MAFLTGSRVYGKPQPGSDIDLCVLVTPTDFDLLFAAAHPQSGPSSDIGSRDTRSTLIGKDSIAVRYGKLNVLMTTNPEMYEAWRAATLSLTALKDHGGPVTREKAVEVFTKHEEAVR